MASGLGALERGLLIIHSFYFIWFLFFGFFSCKTKTGVRICNDFHFEVAFPRLLLIILIIAIYFGRAPAFY